MKFIKNLQGTQNTAGTYSFVMVDTGFDSEDEYENVGLTKKGYTYKFTPCSATVAETISAIRAELQTRGGSQLGQKLNLYKFSNLKETLATADTKILSTISDKYVRSQKSHILVDTETQSARNNGQVLASASTGDILYLSTDPSGKQSSEQSAPGMSYFKSGNILYYPCLKDTKQSINKFNNTKMSHKFIIEFLADFSNDIDHAAVFSLVNNTLSYECTVHPNYQKKDYRVLVEKQKSGKNVIFYMFCIQNTGKVLSPVLLGNYVI